MRPLELTIKNFRSFRGEHRFDWRERRLVAITGPIGSGKTSILDAMAFGLYGQTPQIGRDVQSLINQQSAEAHVRLLFAVGEDLWQVERAQRRRGQGITSLFPCDVDEQPDRLAGTTGVRAVNERVKEILGIDFAGFTRSILLPQGQFANFLKSPKSEKDRVLKGIFRLERIDQMRELARSKSAALDLEVNVNRRELAAAQAAAARSKELAPEHAEALSRAKLLTRLQPEVAANDAAQAAEQALFDRLGSDLADVKRAAESLPRPEQATESWHRFRRAVKEAGDAGANVDAHQSRVFELEAQHALDLAAVGGSAGLARSEQLVREHELAMVANTNAGEALSAGQSDWRAATAELVTTKAAGVDAAAKLKSLESVASGLCEQEVTATATLEQLQSHDLALNLQIKLRAGDDCPVCGQPIDRLPRAHLAGDVKSASASLRDAKRAFAAISEELAELRRRQAIIGERLCHAESSASTGQAAVQRTTMQLTASAERLAVAAGAVTESLGPGVPAELLAAHRQRVDRMSEELQEARWALDDAHDQVRSQRAEADRERQVLDKLHREIAVGAGRIGAEGLATTADSNADPGPLIKQLQEKAEIKRQRIELDRLKHVAEIEKLTAGRADLLTQADLTADADLIAAIAAAHAREAELGEQLRTARRLAASAPALAGKVNALVRRLGGCRRLAEDLRSRGFLNFLLADKRAQLAELGGVWVRQLTADRFGFAADDSFAVIDFAAADSHQASRSSDTLSGGETFLASLGLALALADLVAGQGGRLGSFFLDEGFGSLDDQHLDIAMSGIERLAAESSDRLVVIVSHVDAVKDRIDDRIELQPDRLLGMATSVVSGATLA